MTVEELSEIEALPLGMMANGDMLFRLCQALREAWERIAELEGALAEWYLASDDDAVGAETAAHDRLIELATVCAWAKQEAKPNDR